METQSPSMYLCNRLIVCTFALCMLWTTTLANCVYLVNLYFQVPNFSLVMNHCMDFARVVDRNENNYHDCVTQQLSTCKLNLDITYNQQKIRISQHEANNLLFEDQFSSIVQNCSSQYDELQSNLQSWLKIGANHTIPYTSTCSPQQRNLISQLLNDQSKTNDAVQSSANGFIATTNARMAALVTYSDQLSTYNRDYIRNKTNNLHLQSMKLSIDASIDIQAYLEVQQLHITRTFDEMIACLSLDNNASLSCPFPINAAYLYNFESNDINVVIRGMQRTMSRANASVLAYRAQVMQVLTNFNNFYRSIVSNTGIIAWVVQNTMIPSASYLCGRSSPNWCSFSAVSMKSRSSSLSYLLSIKLTSPSLLSCLLSFSGISIFHSLKLN